MQPRIQYVTSADGVRIAYTVMGEGPPIVFAPNAWGGIEQFIKGTFSDFSPADFVLRRGYRAVVYDGRGTAASERDVIDMSQAARLGDLEAVVDRLGIERFPIYGQIHGCLAALCYAAKHPERVSHLVLWNPYASGADYYAGAPMLRAIKALSEIADDNWELVTLTLCNWINRFTDTDAAEKVAAMYRSTMEPHQYRRFLAGNEQADVSEILSQIRTPTRVLLDPSTSFSYPEVTRAVAAAIPGAELITVGRFEASFEAVLDFIGGEESQNSSLARDLPTGMTAVLFADIADSTGLTERLGDTAFRAKARELDAALRAVIRDHAGTPIEGKLLGDGVLAVFTSAREAIAAALACGRSGGDAGLPLHLGLHAGDVIREDDPDGRSNVYGGAVNIASRIAGLSAAGEVLVSETVRSLARTSAGVQFEDRGEQTLKGVGEAVRVWAVRKSE